MFTGHDGEIAITFHSAASVARTDSRGLAGPVRLCEATPVRGAAGRAGRSDAEGRLTRHWRTG